MFITTPVEQYGEIFVKREDLCAPAPMPPLSKMRGVAVYLQALKAQGVQAVGVLDTRISKSGLGVACISRDLGLTCRYYFPARKGEEWLTPTRKTACEQGATLVPMPAGRIAILYARARRQEPGEMLPLGFPLFETVEETAREVETVSPDVYHNGTVILACGTGTILSGVILGLARAEIGREVAPKRIVGVTAAMNVERVAQRVQGHLNRVLATEPGLNAALNRALSRVRLYRGEGEYYDEARLLPPWPAHSQYEGKAWVWLEQHRQALPRPILFWNVGA